MLKVLEAKPLPGYKIRVRYQDGVEGEVDLSRFAGKGVFSALTDRTFFEKVHVSPHGSIAWTDDVELCADSIYLELTGKKPEDLFPQIAVARP